MLRPSRRPPLLLPLAATLLACAALVPSAGAKGTLYTSGHSAVDNLVDAQSIGAGGVLTPLGTPVNAGAIGVSRAVAMTPDAKHLYTAGFNGGIAGFSVAAGGALTPLAGSPLATNRTDVTGLAITPDGRFLYLSSSNGGAGTVSILAIAPDGTLSIVDQPALGTPTPRGLAVSPNGAFLFVTNAPDGKVSTFRIGGDGKLTPAGAGPVAGGDFGVAVTPDGTRVYASDRLNNKLTGYAVGADGTLTPVASVATGTDPATVAITGDGRFVYAANFGSAGPGTLSGYAIAASGALTAIPGQPFAAVNAPYGLAAAPSGRLYSASFDPVLPGKLNGYAVGADGALAGLTGSPFASQISGAEYQSVAITPDQGPVAGAIGAPAAVAGKPVTLSAGAAADTDGGAVARYDWAFGDGQTLASGGPAPAHVYGAAGTYTASVTVTDDESCSTASVFTGQTALCNGNAAARSQVAVTVAAAAGGPGVQPTVLKPKLGGAPIQGLGSTVTVTAVCGVPVACRVAASGRLVVKTPASRHGKRRIKARTQTFKLGGVTRSVTAGGKVSLKLTVSKSARGAATRAIARHGKVTAQVSVRASIPNSAVAPRTATRTVRLVVRRKAPARKHKG